MTASALGQSALGQSALGQSALGQSATGQPIGLGAPAGVPDALPAGYLPPSSRVATRFKRDSFLLVGSTIAVGLGNYGYSLALIWVLPARQFAVVAAMSTLVVIAATAATAALPWVLADEVAGTSKRSERRRQAVGFTAVSSIAAGAVAVAVVAALSSAYASTSEEVAVAIWVLAVFTAQVGTGYLQGEGRFGVAASASVAEVVLKVGLGLSLAAVGWKAAGALGGAALATVGWAAAGAIFVGRDVAWPSRSTWERLWRRAAGIGGVQVGVVILTTLDVVVGAIRFRGTDAIAGYQAMLVFARVPLFVSSAMSSVAFRRMVVPGGDGRRAVRETMALYLICVVPVVAVVTTIPTHLMAEVLPAGYSRYVSLLVPLGIAGLAAGQINVTTTFFQASARIRPALVALWPAAAGTALLLILVGTSVHDLAWCSAGATTGVALVLTVMASRTYRSGVAWFTSAAILATGLLFWFLHATRGHLVLWVACSALLGLVAAGATRRAHHADAGRSRRHVPPALRRWLLDATTRAVTSLRAAAPPDAVHLVLAARSLAGAGPMVTVPTARRALILAPHPDDETIGCGGTAAWLSRCGRSVSVAVVTSGEMSVAGPGRAREVSLRRRTGANSACRALGVDEPVFLGLPDGCLDLNRQILVAWLRQLLYRFQPDTVFVPWPLDDHPDHVSVAAALADVDLPPGCQVWCYEVWTALVPNRIVDITSTWDAKVHALECHRSGREHFDLDSHLALSRWRSVFGLSGQGHAEAFLALDQDDFRRLVGAVVGGSGTGGSGG